MPCSETSRPAVSTSCSTRIPKVAFITQRAPKEALKVNAPLALIGATVAEFFGSPTVGMGFRITTEAGRLAMEMVWAEAAFAAALGTLFYGAVALAERVATFWHASIRAVSSAVA